jgi:hypothetical protein
MTPYLTASFLDWHEMKTVSKTAECHQPHVLWSGSTAMYRCRLPAPGDASAATWTMIHGSASFENDGCLAGASRMARADFLAPESTNHPRLRRLSVDGNSPNLTWFGGLPTRGAKGGKTRPEPTLGLEAQPIHTCPGRDSESLRRTPSPEIC